MDKHESARHYRLVAQAIAYIRSHALQQPSLTQVAAEVGLSEYHFSACLTNGQGYRLSVFYNT